MLADKHVMADLGGLQLLPETRKKIEIKIPGENRLLFVGGFLFLIVIILIAGLYLYKNSLKNNLSGTLNSLSSIEQKRDKATEQKILIFNKQASLLSKLLNDHPYWTSAFSKIESLLQNQVQINSMTASLADNKVDFKAMAANYTTIARQIASFLSDDSVSDVTLSKVSTLTNGRLEFTMQLIFNRNKFLKSR